tara:strand:+ start:7165 stop:8034 length:870 start_codon:yes stop_codon:yes gene_type:complete
MEVTLSRETSFGLQDNWRGKESRGVFHEAEQNSSASAFEMDSWSDVLLRAPTNAIDVDEQHETEIIDASQVTDTEMLEVIDEPGHQDAQISVKELELKLEEAERNGFERANSELANDYELRLKALTEQIEPLLENIDLMTQVSDDVIEALTSLAIKVGEKLSRVSLESSSEVVREFIVQSLNAADQDLEGSARLRLPKDWKDLIAEAGITDRFPNLAVSFDHRLLPGDLEVDFGGIGFEDLMSRRLDQLRLQIDSDIARDDDAEMERALGSSELTDSPLTQADESERSE